MTREEMIDKCVAFSVKINNLRTYIRENHHERNNSDQIQRSGTSIGANYCEACHAESKADFVHKMGVALKEANETMYWLRVLCGSGMISQVQYEDIMTDLDEIYRILSASVKTAKTGLKIED